MISYKSINILTEFSRELHIFLFYFFISINSLSIHLLPHNHFQQTYVQQFQCNQERKQKSTIIFDKEFKFHSKWLFPPLSIQELAQCHSHNLNLIAAAANQRHNTTMSIEKLEIHHAATAEEVVHLSIRLQSKVSLFYYTHFCPFTLPLMHSSV